MTKTTTIDQDFAECRRLARSVARLEVAKWIGVCLASLCLAIALAI